ncbi:AraC family transcriptional regulator [Stackebrandtia nassauensis]|uniref:Transcriptional regulator, AraC family n=1 Tax=Stackebrandtia nassauensis (strain DSM 44728 / CIP 108903 / NRRL B-16338 / NBRC 102104 / LLR-40K-21) TaxID=446470 RepID=D3QBM0_STANL|nr:AraC family transcriptional regulator [Stackebrandtia nassauensis]ADD42902.1 transcriptional regulator, AraC family [Stackebrandtia nassauensis DSM 44728]
MVFDSAVLDLQPYTGFDMDRFVRRTHCSWHDNGWQSLLVQRFDHATVAEDMRLPGTSDIHLVLPLAGRAQIHTTTGGRARRHTWAPGRLELLIPGQPLVRAYQSDSPMRSVQVHIPRTTVETTADQLGGRDVDYEAMAASLATGDALVEELLRQLADSTETSDLYAETSAAFLATHLLTRHQRGHTPDGAPRDDTRVRAAITMMRDQLAQPITLADLAAHVHLSVFHFVTVFKQATGHPPHRYLARLRIAEAKRLLRGTNLTIAAIATRCGFASPGALSTAFTRHTGTRPSAYRET